MWDNTSRSREELKGWIKRSLGCGVIHVELTDDHLNDAIVEAEEYFQMWSGTIKMVVVDKGSGVAIAEADIADDISSVVDVYFGSETDSISQYYSWADVQFNPFQEGASGQYGGMSTILQYLQYRKDAQRLLSSDYDWQWNRATREVILSPESMAAGNKVGIVYISKDLDYSKMRAHEWKMFREYAQAKSMRKLAIIRMKFSDKPSATGGFTMDGDAMWANAEAMELMIEDKMRNLQDPVGIIIG